MNVAERRSRAVPGGERIFQRIYTRIGCEGRPPRFVVEYHPYADLTHTIRLREDRRPTFASPTCSAMRRAQSSRQPLESCWDGCIAASRPRNFWMRIEIIPTLARRAGRLLMVRQRRARRAEHRPAGVYHDLDPMFERLNARYFTNALVNRDWAGAAASGVHSSAALIPRSSKS